jgi:hypothetical protein
MSALRRGSLAAAAALAAWVAAGAWASPVAAQQPTPAALRTTVEPLILSPEPGERVLQDGVLVAVSFVDRDAQLDPLTVRLEVDGRDVTAEAQISAEVVTWRPRQPMEAGPHRASLTALDRGGGRVGPVDWAFTVAPGFEGTPSAADLQPVSTSFTRLQGSVTFEGSGRSISGAGASLLADEKQVPRLWVNAAGLISGSWRYSARMHLSGYESKERQPVNRFRFDVRSNHLNVGVGDVNPIVHDLMLAGARVRGVEGDLRGGPLRLTVVKGQTRRGIVGLADNAAAQILRAGTYEQNLTAVRPAFGIGPVELGITAMRVTDDTTSIPDQRITGILGTSRRVNPTPKDNVVAGTDLTVRLLGSRVLLQYENAFSLLANDITGGPLTKAELDALTSAAGFDELGVDPADFSDWFVINQSLIPLDPRGGSSVAHLATASVRAGTNIVAAEWRSIGGAYYSLAYPALLRDRTGIRIRDSFTALQGALAVTGGFETDKDNLERVKPATTTNSGIFAQASWQESPRALALVGSVRQGSRSNDLANGQTGAMDETTNAVSLGAGIPVTQLAGYATRLNLNVTAVNRDDVRNPAVDSKDRYFVVGLEGETDSRANRFNVAYGLNTTQLTSVATSKTHYHRVVGNFRYLVVPRFTATLDGTYTTASTPDAAANLAWGLKYNRRELLAGGEFEWTAASFVRLTAGVVQYADEFVPTRDTRELVTRITVHRAF